MRKLILTDEQIKEILRLYNEDLVGSQTISEKMGINKHIILRTLKENGIELGPSGRRFIGGKKIADKKWRGKNKAYMSEKHKKWSESKREHLNQYHKEWREKNIDKHRENKRNYERTRKANDPLYKLVANFRTAIYTVLKENNMDKYGHYFEILQYSPEQLSDHLENQFTEGMEWENYGEWHVDHKTPITAFNFQEIGDNEFMKCWSLDNLQPMWGDENIRKSNKII
jgi:hypothetical protein